MLIREWLTPVYARQKDFYNKAYYIIRYYDNFKELELFSDTLSSGFVKVAKIVIDNKHASKNRYYITNNSKLLEATTIKHIYDFIFQKYVHKTTKNKLLRRGVILKDRLFKYALELD
jgi:hypothetical protein